MTGRLRGAALMLALLGSGCAPTPWHQALLDRHVEARGGVRALQALRVIEREGRFTFHDPDPEVVGTYRTCIQYPEYVVVDVNAGPAQVHQVLGRHGALECDADFKACRPASEDVAEELRATARHANREELEKPLPDVAVVEPILRDGVRVGFRFMREDRVLEEEFSPETGLLVRHRSGSRERYVGDWGPAGDILLPRRIVDFFDGKKVVTIELHRVTHANVVSEWCERRLDARVR